MSDGWPKGLVVRPLSLNDARRIAGWRYDGPWQVYDPRREDGLLDPDQGYWAVAGVSGGRLVGFCCAGAEARVPGLAEEPGLLDVGVGMDPAWVGGGHGAAFGQAVVDHFARERAVEGLRAVVQSWNERSLRLSRRLGFVEVGRHVCSQDGRVVEYAVVVARVEPWELNKAAALGCEGLSTATPLDGKLAPMLQRRPPRPRTSRCWR